MKRRFYVFSTDVITFAAVNDVRPFTVPIENTMDFVWTEGFYSSDVAAVMAGTDTVHGGALVTRLGDGGTQESIVKAGRPTPLAHIFARPGVSRDARDLPWIMRFASNGVIAGELQNLVAGAQNVRLTFCGFLIPGGEPI